MKIAVITGASSGMGREFVRQIPHFYMNLDELWIISRRKDRLEAIAKTCSVPVRIFAGDLTDPMFLQTVKDTLQRLRPGYPDAGECSRLRKVYCFGYRKRRVARTK